MTKRLASILTAAAVMTAVVGVAGGPAGAQVVPVRDQDFASYGTGTAVSLDVLQLGQTQAVSVQAAFAGQSTDSTGLGGVISNEMGYTVQPGDIGDRSAYGRGTGLEVGVAVPITAAENQILLAGLAEAAAPPPTALVVRQIGPVSLGGVAYVNLLRGRARATFDPTTCVLGRPMSFGEGEAAGLQLIGTTNAVSGQLDAPVLGASLPVTGNDPRNVSRSRSVTYLIPNGDGTFGLVSETRQTVAPIQLVGGLITIELLGEWALRAIATGKPGGARIEYAPVGAVPDTKVAVITLGGITVADLSLQDILGPGGLVLPLAPIADARIGAPARAINGSGPAVTTADGTIAAGAVDVISLDLLDLSVLGLPVNALDLRVGHMEAAVRVPVGGVRCNIPVSKVGPTTVQAGNNATIVVRIPSDAGQFAELFGCELLNIKAQDVHSVRSGRPTFSVVSASNGGVISADRTVVTWPNLGNYRIGDPPIELTIVVSIPSSSLAGVIEDTVDVTASLGNCVGGDSGQDIVGAAINGLGVSNAIAFGRVTLIGPSITIGGILPPTGGNAMPLIAGGGLVLAALALRRRFAS